MDASTERQSLRGESYQWLALSLVKSFDYTVIKLSQICFLF